MKLLTRLKQSDLVAMSAALSLRENLGVSFLQALERFKLWEIDTQGDVAPVLTSSYYLGNTNKEEFLLAPLYLGADTAEFSRFILKVSPRTKASHDRIKSQIQTHFGIKIRALACYTLWRIVVSGAPESAHDRVLNEIVRSQSYRAGLLVNPISESYELCSEAEFLESFNA